MRTPDRTVTTDRFTADDQLQLIYTIRQDPPHNPLHFDFRWVDKAGTVVATFAAASEAYIWQDGYDAGVEASKKKPEVPRDPVADSRGSVKW